MTTRKNTRDSEHTEFAKQFDMPMQPMQKHDPKKATEPMPMHQQEHGKPMPMKKK